MPAFTLVCAIGLFVASMLGEMTNAMTAHRELLALAAGPYTALTVAGTIAGIAVALPLGALAVAIARTTRSRCAVTSGGAVLVRLS